MVLALVIFSGSLEFIIEMNRLRKTKKKIVIFIKAAFAYSL